MASEDRILGELMEFKRQMNVRMDRLESKVEIQERWRWKFIGACMAFNAVLLVVCEVGRAVLHSGP